MAKQFHQPPDTPETDAPRKAPSARGEALTTRPATRTEAARTAPKHDPDRQWAIDLVHSDNWDLSEVDGKPYLLPDFEFRRCQPGTNGIRQRKKGDPDTRLHDGKLMEQGRRLVPREEYLTVSETVDEDGNLHRFHYLRFEEPRVYKDGSVLVKWDAKGWDAWRIDLLKRRLVDAPTDLAVERIRRRLEADRDRAGSHMSDVRAAAKRERAMRLLGLLDDAATNSRTLAGEEAA